MKVSNHQVAGSNGMRLRTCLASMALAITALQAGVASAQAVQPGALAQREYDDAVATFKAGRTSEAFGRFMDLANRGDADAARIALFMNQYGTTLYGKYWDVLPRDVDYWQQLVRNSGTAARPVAEFQPLVVGSRKPGTRVAVARNTATPALQKVVARQ